MTTLDAFKAGFLGQEAGYLNYASIGPLTPVARDEQIGLMEIHGRARFGAIENVRAERSRASAAIAELTGFAAEAVIDQPNTSTALMHAMFATTGGVLLSRSEFPALPYAVQRSAEVLGRLTPLWLSPEDGRVTPELVRAHLDVDVDAVAVSLVDARTGFVADLSALRDVIGDRLLIVDVIQGFGVVDADYAAADVIAGGGHKWLRAGRGTGFLALSDFAIERMSPVMSGLYGSVDPRDWDAVREPADGIDAYRISAPDLSGQGRLAASLEEIIAVGVAPIAAAIAERAEQVLELADEAGIAVSSPREARDRAGIIILNPGADRVGQLGAALHNAGVSVTVREDRVRVSVHAGTDDDTLMLLASALREFGAATGAHSPAPHSDNPLESGFIVLSAPIGETASPVASATAGAAPEAAEVSEDPLVFVPGPIAETVTITAAITLSPSGDPSESDETAPVSIIPPRLEGLAPLSTEAPEPKSAAAVAQQQDETEDGAEADVEPEGADADADNVEGAGADVDADGVDADADADGAGDPDIDADGAAAAAAAVDFADADAHNSADSDHAAAEKTAKSQGSGVIPEGEGTKTPASPTKKRHP